MKNSYFILLIDESIYSLESKEFSTFNANSAYWQIELDQYDMGNTAFVTHIKLYRFSHMFWGQNRSCDC